MIHVLLLRPRALHIAAMKTHCCSHKGPRTDTLLGRLGHTKEREREREIAMKTHFSSCDGPRIEGVVGSPRSRRLRERERESEIESERASELERERERELELELELENFILQGL